MTNEHISQWNLSSEDSNISGIGRYENEIYSQCSKHVDVSRYRSQRNKVKTFLNYKAGDVTHITTQQLAFLKTFRHVKNCAVTVHDLIPCSWFGLKRKCREYWVLNDLFLDNVDMFIAISEYTKLDLIDRFNIPDEKIKVVYNGVDHYEFHSMNKQKCRKLFGLDPEQPYLLSVSSSEEWKNTSVLKELPFEVIEIGYGKGNFGYVPESMMPALYCACDAFLAPSLHEGFCLPAVESMACGTPVIATNKTALPEVVGSGGILVNPFDITEWLEAIDTVLSSPEKWKRKAVERASLFSWEKCGKETVDVYREMVE